MESEQKTTSEVWGGTRSEKATPFKKDLSLGEARPSDVTTFISKALKNLAAEGGSAHGGELGDGGKRAHSSPRAIKASTAEGGRMVICSWERNKGEAAERITKS